MTNFFKDVLGNLDGLEQKLLGPDYAYYKQINSPEQVGMSGDGNFSALGDDIAGLVSYTQLLVEGGGKASKIPGPLGDRFFVQTGAKCKDQASGQQVIRSIYINNIPDGNIPFISSGLGHDFTEFGGLVPGALSSLGSINPLAIFQAFLEGTNPDCMATKLEVVDTSNNAYYDTKYLTVSDIQGIDPCWFPDHRNPITGESRGGCNPSRVGFQNLHEPASPINQYSTIISYLYFTSLLLLFCYLLVKSTKK